MGDFNNHSKSSGQLSSFSIILVFVLLTLIGLSFSSARQCAAQTLQKPEDHISFLQLATGLCQGD
jgi:hypothetical protein